MGGMLSWILFALACVAALFTLNAYRPVRRNRVLFVPSFFASWLTIELAWIHLFWEVVGAAVLVWLGALDRPIGWVGLIIAVLNWLALAVIVFRGRSAAKGASEVLAVLDDDNDAVEVVDKGKVVRVKNLEYRRVAGKVMRLDVTAPKTPPADGVLRPALLQIHGGAWIIGDKREQGLPLIKHLASRGWVCFNANYRLSPGATWPDPLTDLKHALAWIRRHADEYHVDPNFVAVTGGSAGGHLTAMMALTANDPEYQQGIEDADTSLQAAVPIYGVYDFTNRNQTMPPQFLPWILEPLVMKEFLADAPEAFAKASPIDNVHAGAPPFLVVHGDNDTLAPVQDARTFVQDLAEVSKAPVFYLELHGAQHAFDVFSSVRTRRVIRAVYRFLSVMHARYRAGISETVAPSEDEMVDGAVRVDDASDVERAAS
jgi:acetyl esterase/lipase